MTITNKESELQLTYKFAVKYPARWLIKRERTAKFEINSLCLKAMTKIANEAAKINTEYLKEDMSALEATYKIAAENGISLVKIVAYAILNNDEEPSDKMLKTLGYMNPNDLKDAYLAIVERMNLQSFMIGMIAIQGANILNIDQQKDNEIN